MSLGYAEKLSYRDDLGGQLGNPELSEDPAELERKVEQLVKLVCACFHQLPVVYSSSRVQTP